MGNMTGCNNPKNANIEKDSFAELSVNTQVNSFIIHLKDYNFLYNR